MESSRDLNPCTYRTISKKAITNKSDSSTKQFTPSVRFGLSKSSNKNKNDTFTEGQNKNSKNSEKSANLEVSNLEETFLASNTVENLPVSNIEGKLLINCSIESNVVDVLRGSPTVNTLEESPAVTEQKESPITTTPIGNSSFKIKNKPTSLNKPSTPYRGGFGLSRSATPSGGSNSLKTRINKSLLTPSRGFGLSRSGACKPTSLKSLFADGSKISENLNSDENKNSISKLDVAIQEVQVTIKKEVQKTPIGDESETYKELKKCEEEFPNAIDNKLMIENTEKEIDRKGKRKIKKNSKKVNFKRNTEDAFLAEIQKNPKKIILQDHIYSSNASNVENINTNNIFNISGDCDYTLKPCSVLLLQSDNNLEEVKVRDQNLEIAQNEQKKRLHKSLEESLKDNDKDVPLKKIRVTHAQKVTEYSDESQLGSENEIVKEKVKTKCEAKEIIESEKEDLQAKEIVEAIRDDLEEVSKTKEIKEFELSEIKIKSKEEKSQIIKGNTRSSHQQKTKSKKTKRSLSLKKSTMSQDSLIEDDFPLSCPMILNQTETEPSTETNFERRLNSIEIKQLLLANICSQSSKSMSECSLNSQYLSDVEFQSLEKNMENENKKYCEENLKVLEKSIQEKRKLLDDLKRAQLYREKNNIDDLKLQREIWKKGCISALRDLLVEVNKYHRVNMNQLIVNLKIPPNILNYSIETDSFK